MAGPTIRLARRGAHLEGKTPRLGDPAASCVRTAASNFRVPTGDCFSNYWQRQVCSNPANDFNDTPRCPAVPSTPGLATVP